MVRPANFGFNKETAASNPFQRQPGLSKKDIQAKALFEFDEFATILENSGVHVIIAKDSSFPIKTDAVFPNNWISTHSDNSVIIYPMFSANRRTERQMGVVDQLKTSFSIVEEYDFTNEEAGNCFVEGTGSMVLDRVNKQAFACLSNRTDLKLLKKICKHLVYEAVVFHATDLQGLPIYHTNVMMSIGSDFAVVCAETIKSKSERSEVLNKLNASGHEVIEISQHQMAAFAGNMLEVRGDSGNKLIILSRSALESLKPVQLDRLSRYGKLLPISIPTIETIGGGSVRCMMAEIFLTPLK